MCQAGIHGSSEIYALQNLEALANPIWSCAAGGKPMPSITWFKNGVEMKNNKDQNQITVDTNKQKEQVQLS